MDTNTKSRGQWSGRIGFVLAAAGSAIGLGNIWSFPYITGTNGGGAFVLVYLLCILLVGFPIMIAEIMIGRKTQKSPVGAFADLTSPKSPWCLVGFLGVLAGFLILSFYSVVAGWTFNYIFLSITNYFGGKNPEQIKGVFKTLQESSIRQILWHLLFMGTTLAIVFGGIKKGIEKWSKILMPMLFAMLIALIIYSIIFLNKGFIATVNFTFVPKSKLLPSSVLTALGQAFFSLSLGMGAMLTYGSYMSKESDVSKSALSVCFMDTLIALFACLMIFPIVFHYGKSPSQGPGLVFQTMPVLFSTIKGSLIVSLVFFLLLGFAALTSSISLLEVVTSYFIDQWGWSRKKAAIITAAVIFLIGIPSTGAVFGWWKDVFGKSFFDSVFILTFKWMLPIGGLFIAIYVGWFMDGQERKEEFLTGSKLQWLYPIWLFFLRFIVPVLVIIVLFKEIGVLKTEMINKFFGVK